MAIVNFSSIIAGANLGGLSTDAKPTVNVPTGYVFLEFDTGNRFIFNAGSWYPLTDQTSVGWEFNEPITTGVKESSFSYRKSCDFYWEL